jgi:hypothetical protein
VKRDLAEQKRDLKQEIESLKTAQAKTEVRLQQLEARSQQTEAGSQQSEARSEQLEARLQLSQDGNKQTQVQLSEVVEMLKKLSHDYHSIRETLDCFNATELLGEIGFHLDKVMRQTMFGVADAVDRANPLTRNTFVEMKRLSEEKLDEANQVAFTKFVQDLESSVASVDECILMIQTFKGERLYPAYLSKEKIMELKEEHIEKASTQLGYDHDTIEKAKKLFNFINSKAFALKIAARQINSAPCGMFNMSLYIYGFT